MTYSNSAGWQDITGGTTSATGSDYRIIVTSPVGTSSSVNIPTGKSRSLPGTTPRRISPKLYFNYVKSKLQKSEQQRLKNRLVKLQTLAKDAFDLRQEALYQEFSKMIAIAVRESEAVACGYDRWVSLEDINRFKDISKEEGATKSQVFFKPLNEFPRSLPTEVGKLTYDLKKKGLFDQLWVLYLDYTHEEIKTNKEKIREKDPILFGQFAFDKARYFFITDWTDQYCDLTLTDFIDRLSTNDEQFKTNRVPDIDESFIRKIQKEVEEREARLNNTNRDNYKELMAEEDRKIDSEIKENQDKTAKKPWYKRFTQIKRMVI